MALAIVLRHRRFFFGQTGSFRSLRLSSEASALAQGLQFRRQVEPGALLETAMSSSLEFMVPKAESGVFNAALYRFLESRSGATDDDVMGLKSEPFGPVDRKSVTLWSEDALRDFVDYWSSFRRGQTARGAAHMEENAAPAS